MLYFFAFDPDNPNSILSAWTSARENARSIREQIASEMWESLNISYLQLREWDVDRVLAGGPHEFFQMVEDASHLFQGILNRTMMMGEARDWLDTGRFLERAGQTARLLDVKYHDLLTGGAGAGHDEMRRSGDRGRVKEAAAWTRPAGHARLDRRAEVGLRLRDVPQDATGTASSRPTSSTFWC